MFQHGRDGSIFAETAALPNTKRRSGKTAIT
jgi:hypothetical protein